MRQRSGGRFSHPAQSLPEPEESGGREGVDFGEISPDTYPSEPRERDRDADRGGPDREATRPEYPDIGIRRILCRS